MICSVFGDIKNNLYCNFSSPPFHHRQHESIARAALLFSCSQSFKFNNQFSQTRTVRSRFVQVTVSLMTQP